MQPERGFKAALTRAFAQCYRFNGGWYSYIPPGPGSKRGMPDLILCTGLGAVWIEAKARTGSLAKEQRQVLNDLLMAGHRVRIVQEGDTLAAQQIALADVMATRIVAPRAALAHSPFWDLVWA